MRGTASTEYRKKSILIQLSCFYLEGVQGRSRQLSELKSLCAVKGEILNYSQRGKNKLKATCTHSLGDLEHKWSFNVDVKMEKHRDNDGSSLSLVCSETLRSLLTRANENTDVGWKREGKKHWEGGFHLISSLIMRNSLHGFT